MSIVLLDDIRASAQAAAISTVEGKPVINPHCPATHPAHAAAWDEAYESAMHELGCFA
jgi:hypothetical protein